jgi:chromosome segregation ATPase
MAKIFGLFTWKADEPTGGRSGGTASVGEDSQRYRDLVSSANAPFEQLGQNHQLIDGEIGAAIEDIAIVADLQKRLLSLRTDVARAFDQHRKLAVTSVSLERERDRYSAALAEKAAVHDVLLAEMATLRSDFDALRHANDQITLNFENLEARYHAEAAARKDVEDRLQASVSENSSLLDDNESLRIQARLLSETADSNQTRAAELSERLNEAEARLLHANNMCETIESSLQERADEIANVRALLEVAQQEKDAATGYSRLKEQEVMQLRNDQARLMQQMQQEKQSREQETTQLRSELESLRTSARSYEEIASASRVKAEKLGPELQRLQERNVLLEASNERLEARLTRLASKLDVATSTKQQIEQSRTAINARLEAANQLLAEREMAIKRLEAKLDSITEKTSQAAALQQDKIDALSARVFELESELTERRNELALYVSQLEVIQGNPKRARRRD